jgi:ADP-ribose pyrophosphatase YjhB (NUDIX family)
VILFGSIMAGTIRIRVSALVTDGRRLLVVRHRKDGREYRLLPGGGVEFGEPVLEALEREVREETGLEIESGRLLATTETIYPDGGRHILHLVFHAPRWSGTLRQEPEDERVQGAEWIRTEDLDELPFLPDILDSLREQLDAGCSLPARHLCARWITIDSPSTR